jgi:iron complex outermembrane receptor protein
VTRIARSLKHRRRLCPGIGGSVSLHRSAAQAWLAAIGVAISPGNPVRAQQADDSQLDTIVITGSIARSIESSVNKKRSSDSIVEVVSAEDLGKLPDLSIAESIARLPGVAAQRVEGQSQALSIRGLAPDYAVTLLNGREIVSTGAGRSVEFDQFPAELVDQVTVYKTPDAALGAQGLSGTINMTTIRPLDLKERRGNLNVRGETSSYRETVPGIARNGARLSASFVDQYADHTIGMALGFAHLDSPEKQRKFGAWWWANPSKFPADWCANAADPYIPDCLIPGLATDAVALQGFQSSVVSSSQVRDGYMGVLEFKPGERFHSTIDAYYSRFSRKYAAREFASPMDSWTAYSTGVQMSYANPTYSDYHGDKVLTGGTAYNVPFRQTNRDNRRNDNIYAVGWNSELALDQWKFVADLSASSITRHESTSELDMVPTVPVGYSSFSINLANDISRFTPSIDASNPALERLADVWGYHAAERVFRVKDDLRAIRISADRKLAWGPFNTFDAGVNLTRRSKDYSHRLFYYHLPKGASDAIPAQYLLPAADLSPVGVPSGIGVDVRGIINSGLFTEEEDTTIRPGQSWGIEERVGTFFSRLGIETHWLVPWRGNLGLQVVSARQTGLGYAYSTAAQAYAPVSGGTSYTDVLPSLNLIGELPHGTLLRLGLARVLARPDMEAMRAGVDELSRDLHPPFAWTGTGGNPLLEPWRARDYDLSLEKYFGHNSYVGVAVFRKALESTVYDGKVRYDFTGYPDPIDPKSKGYKPPTNFQGFLDAPANGNGGRVQGTELSLALDLGLVAAPLAGLGVIASQSITTSNIHQGNNPDNPLEGLSGRVNSTVMYYEKHGFETRIAHRYRSRFLAKARDIHGLLSYSTIEPQSIVDFEIGYGFESGRLKGLSVLFQVENLTDEPDRTMMSVSGDGPGNNPLLLYPGDHNTFARQYLLGVNYKF